MCAAALDDLTFRQTSFDHRDSKASTWPDQRHYRRISSLDQNIISLNPAGHAGRR